MGLLKTGEKGGNGMNLIKWLSISDRHTKMYLDRSLAPLCLNSSQHM